MDRTHLHEIVDAMPECGLAELLAALEAMLEFYRERESYVPVPPPQEVVRAAGQLQ